MLRDKAIPHIIITLLIGVVVMGLWLRPVNRGVVRRRPGGRGQFPLGAVPTKSDQVGIRMIYSPPEEIFNHARPL
jgi:hypothetical protein